jgi:WD40 repeat protein
VGSIYCTEFSKDDDLIATGSNDKSIKILNLKELKDITLTGH